LQKRLIIYARRYSSAHSLGSKHSNLQICAAPLASNDGLAIVRARPDTGLHQRPPSKKGRRHGFLHVSHACWGLAQTLPFMQSITAPTPLDFVATPPSAAVKLHVLRVRVHASAWAHVGARACAGERSVRARLRAWVDVRVCLHACAWAWAWARACVYAGAACHMHCKSIVLT
jgi:hypothetical protein